MKSEVTGGMGSFCLPDYAKMYSEQFIQTFLRSVLRTVQILRAGLEGIKLQ
jgi:hypothetical protein